MKEYERLSSIELEKLSTKLTSNQFLKMYNDAIDEIHYLKLINSELK